MEYQKCISEVIRLFFDGNFPSLRLSSSYACIKLTYHPQTHRLNWIFECSKGGLKKLNWEFLRPQGLRIHSESVYDTIPERKKHLLQKTYFTRKSVTYLCQNFLCVLQDRWETEKWKKIRVLYSKDGDMFGSIWNWPTIEFSAIISW